MKIGIVTHPFRTNYGGILQAFALQIVLEKIGHEVYFVRKEQKKTIARSLAMLIIDRFPTLLGHISIFFNYYKRMNFHAFVKKNIHRYYTLSNSKNENKLDALVVGSDQVWRKWSENWDVMFFFLEFAKDWNVKRYSYAASLGSDKWTFNEEDTNKIVYLLNRFDSISVRERDAIEILKEKFNLKSRWNIDPTLLLTKEDYIRYLCLMPIKKKSIISYILDEDPQKQKILKMLEDTLGSKAIKIGSPQNTCRKRDESLPSIESWLTNFIAAEYVVTDSFHGTAFSINFNKNFVVLSNHYRGQSRLLSILSLFGLENRLVNNDAEAKNILQTPIDWNRINKVLEMERKKSMDYLNVM